MILTTNDEIVDTVNLLCPVVMVWILHIVKQSFRVIVGLQANRQSVASVWHTTQVQQVDSRGYVRGIDQGLRVEGALRSFDSNFVAGINVFDMAVLHHHTTSSFESLRQPVYILYRTDRCLIPDHHDFFRRNLCRKRRDESHVDAKIETGIVNGLQVLNFLVRLSDYVPIRFPETPVNVQGLREFRDEADRF